MAGERIHVNIKAALLCISTDIPAVRKVCGFLGHAARLGCSKCTKEFEGFQPYHRIMFKTMQRTSVKSISVYGLL